MLIFHATLMFPDRWENKLLLQTDEKISCSCMQVQALSCSFDVTSQMTINAALPSSVAVSRPFSRIFADLLFSVDVSMDRWEYSLIFYAALMFPHRWEDTPAALPCNVDVTSQMNAAFPCSIDVSRQIKIYAALPCNADVSRQMIIFVDRLCTIHVYRQKRIYAAFLCNVAIFKQMRISEVLPCNADVTSQMRIYAALPCSVDVSSSRGFACHSPPRNQLDLKHR